MNNPTCNQQVTVGGSGNFTFSGAYAKFNTKQNLEVTSIRSLEEMIASNEDPYRFIYQAVDRTREDMENDLHNGVKIIVFKDAGGQFFYLPANMLVGKPEISGHKYAHRVLSVDVGPLEDTEGYDDLTLDLKTLISAKLGIVPNIKVVTVSADKYISETEHIKFQTARKIRRSDPRNYYRQLQMRNSELEAARKDIQNLECIIKEKVAM